VTPRRAVLRAVVLAVCVLAADQASKAILRGSVGRDERIDVVPGLDIVNTRNTGVAFGFFSGGGTVVALVAALALAALLVFFATHPARVAADRVARRRPRREPDRPRARGGGDGLRRPPAVAGVQRRRRRDHDRRADAAVRPGGPAEPWT
jgi:hypothetical protein